MRAKATPSRSCVMKLAERAASACPERAEVAGSYATAAVRALLGETPKSLYVTQAGDLVLAVYASEARLFRLTDKGASLVYRAPGYGDKASGLDLDGHHWMVVRGSRLDDVDFDSGAVDTTLDVARWAHAGASLLIAKNRSIDVYDWKTRKQIGSATSDTDIESFALNIDADDPRVVLTSNALAFLPTGHVVTGDRVAAASVKDRRALLCRDANLINVNLDSEQEIGTFKTAGGCLSETPPVIAGHGRFAVWFNGNSKDAHLVGHVLDLTSGATTETAPQQEVAGFWDTLTEIDAHGGVCAVGYYKGGADRVCAWTLQGARLLRTGTRVPPTPLSWSQRLGVKGVELATAENEDGSLVAVASYTPARPPPPADATIADAFGAHIVLRVYNPKRRQLLAETLIYDGTFEVDWLDIHMSMPNLTIAGRRVVFSSGSSESLHANLVFNVDNQAVTELEASRVQSSVSRSLFYLDDDKLFDTRTMKLVDLTVDEATYRGAGSLDPLCDENKEP